MDVGVCVSTFFVYGWHKKVVSACQYGKICHCKNVFFSQYSITEAVEYLFIKKRFFFQFLNRRYLPSWYNTSTNDNQLNELPEHIELSHNVEPIVQG